MTEIVEAHGGIVDKYVGDGIVAMFGAPAEDPEQALHAVQAALACRRREFRSQFFREIIGERELQTRIGINTGEIIVGNIGSRQRLNYTVMGDAVNLAARLESANKLYGTSILVSEATMAACGQAVAFREIDHVRVIGRQAPVRIFEPLALQVEITAEHQDLGEPVRLRPLRIPPPRLRRRGCRFPGSGVDYPRRRQPLPAARRPSPRRRPPPIGPAFTIWSRNSLPTARYPYESKGNQQTSQAMPILLKLWLLSGREGYSVKLCAVACVVFLALLSAVGARAETPEKRLALVVGIGAYEFATALPNPPQ